MKGLAFFGNVPKNKTTHILKIVDIIILKYHSSHPIVLSGSIIVNLIEMYCIYIRWCVRNGFFSVTHQCMMTFCLPYKKYFNFILVVCVCEEFTNPFLNSPNGPLNESLHQNWNWICGFQS